MRFLSFGLASAAALALAFIQPCAGVVFPTWSTYLTNTDCQVDPGDPNLWLGVMSTADCQNTCAAKGVSVAVQGADGNCKCGAAAVGCSTLAGFTVYQLGAMSGSWGADAVNTDCATTSRWLGVQSAAACQASCGSFFYAVQGADGNCKCGQTLSQCNSATGFNVTSRVAAPRWNTYLTNTDCQVDPGDPHLWLGVMSTTECQNTCAAKGVSIAVQGPDGNCKCGTSAPSSICAPATNFTVYQFSATPTWSTYLTNTDCQVDPGDPNLWLGVMSTTDCQNTCAAKGVSFAVQGPDANCKCGAAAPSSICAPATNFTVYQLGAMSGSWGADAVNTDCATTSRWLGVQSAAACQASCGSFLYAVQGADGNCKCGQTLSQCNSATGFTVAYRPTA